MDNNNMIMDGMGYILIMVYPNFAFFQSSHPSLPLVESDPFVRPDDVLCEIRDGFSHISVCAYLAIRAIMLAVLAVLNAEWNEAAQPQADDEFGNYYFS